MSKNSKELSFIDIVLNADSETIKQAFEARYKIDTLLIEREEAYQKIYDLEVQIEEVVGETGVFPFPEPPVPVAAFSTKKAKAKKIVRPKAPTPATSNNTDSSNQSENKEAAEQADKNDPPASNPQTPQVSQEGHNKEKPL